MSAFFARASVKFPTVVENAATVFGDTADTNTTLKHLEVIKTVEGLESLFLRKV